MKVYFREADGHCYFLDKRGRLMAAPSLPDSTPAIEVAAYVESFVHPLAPAEQQEIIAFLKADPT